DAARRRSEQGVQRLRPRDAVRYATNGANFEKWLERALPAGGCGARHDAMNGPDDEARVAGGHDGRHREAGRVVAFERAFFGATDLVVDGRFITVMAVGDVETLRKQRRQLAHLVAAGFDNPQAVSVAVYARRVHVWFAARHGRFEELSELSGAVAGDHEDGAELD